MFKYFCIFIYLLSTSLSTYRPFSQKSIDFGDDNICRQTENNGLISIDYVRNCKEGYYCELTDTSGSNTGSASMGASNLFTCKPYTQLLNGLNANCEADSHCDGTLICSSQKKCEYDDTSSSSSRYYEKTDILYDSSSSTLPNFLTKHYCLENKYYYRSTDTSTPTTLTSGCYDLPNGISKDTYNTYSKYIQNNIDYYFEPGFGKVEGEISFKTRNSNDDYNKGNTNTALIGSVETGKFVGNYLACQSGFALNSYGNRKLTKDGANYLSNQFYYCVDVLDVEQKSSGCNVKYTVDGNENIVDSNQHSIPLPCPNLLTQLEIFKNYIEQLKNLYTECEDKKTYEEPFTCRNDELRKWWYFYAHPDEYILYKDKKEIKNYLLQTHYRNYALDLGTGFLNINYIMFLLIILFI